MKAFFYGLFMDRDLLLKKGLNPGKAEVGFVNGYRLQLGQRASMQSGAGERVFGVVMDMSAEELQQLYSEASVADYEPETLPVEIVDGGRLHAVCYNLPSEKPTRVDSHYATALLALATRLGLPESYLDQISSAARQR